MGPDELRGRETWMAREGGGVGRTGFVATVVVGLLVAGTVAVPARGAGAMSMEHSSAPAPLPPPRPGDTAGDGRAGPVLVLGGAAGQRITAGPEADLSDVAGIELARLGVTGRIALERSEAGATADLLLEGKGISDPSERCAVRLSAPEGVPAVPLGRPHGPLRFRVEAPACPLVFDVLDAAVLVQAPEACTFEAADCQAPVAGLWTPSEPRMAALEGRTAGIRAIAAQAVEDNERALGLRGVGAVPDEPFGLEPCDAMSGGLARAFCEARMLAARSMQLARLLGIYPGEGPLAPGPRTPAPPMEILPGRR
jgi:hypothetical protein